MQNQNENLTIEVHNNFSANNLDSCLELAAENVQVITHAFGMTFNGREEFRNFMQGFKQAFPDMKLKHENIVSNGNKVAVEMTATGTHTGPLQTPAGVIPATGKEIELKVSEFFEWENGKFTKITNYQDAGSLMRQIGVM